MYNTPEEVMLAMMAGKITQQEAFAIIQKMATSSTAVPRKKQFKATVSKTGGITLPGRKLGAGPVVWGYASQWISLAKMMPEILRFIYDRISGPIAGEGHMSFYEPGKEGYEGTQRPIRPSDVLPMEELLKGMISDLQGMLPEQESTEQVSAEQEQTEQVSTEQVTPEQESTEQGSTERKKKKAAA